MQADASATQKLASNRHQAVAYQYFASLDLAGIGHIKYQDLQRVLSSYDLDEVALSNLRGVAGDEGRIAFIGFLELLSEACLPRAFVAEFYEMSCPSFFELAALGTTVLHQ